MSLEPKPNPEQQGVLEDLTPVQRQEQRTRTCIAWIVVGVLLLMAFVLLYRKFNPDEPVVYADPQEHFKYGSIGSEIVNGIPYYIFQILPELCADKLPQPEQGYASLGLMFEPGRDLPVGMSKRRVYVDRVGLNCALCHSGAVRETAASSPRLFVAMPANLLELERYVGFLSSCAADARFTPATVMAYVDKRFELGWAEWLLYRYFVVDAVRDALLTQASKMSFLKKNPEWGPGRVDTFNPYKTLQFNFDMSRDTSVGTTDYPSVWNQAPREGMHLHWDGNNSSVHERNMSAALGTGVTPPTLDCESLTRIESYLATLPAPPYPFSIDTALASRGKPLFNTHCAECHDFQGKKTGQVTPLSQIETDKSRLEAWSYPLLSNFNTLYAGYAGEAGTKQCQHVFTHFRKTDGYANMPLDGIWLRGPYLHNGSVPNLRALLEPPANRPRSFYRGNDVFDQENVGFVSTVASEGARRFFSFDTTQVGNGNGGHSFGSELAPEDKRALVEFMKTL